MKSPNPKLSSVVICATLAVTASTQFARGNTNQTGTPGLQTKATVAAAQIKTPAKTLKNSENPEFKSDRLSKVVDLPYMPPYTGKGTDFVTGTAFSHVKGGPSITMQLTVKEDPKTALDWYKANFEQNDWKMLDNMTGANGLAAMKSNNICQVMTLGPSKKGSKCDLLVRYKFYKATDFPNN